MYGRAFASMYTGSMVGIGPDVFAVWGYVLAHERDGEVELNPTLLAAVIGTTVVAVEAAIAKLCEPDARSRNPDDDGCRLVYLRALQYRVVSTEKYKKIRSEADRREQNKSAQQRHRASASVSKRKQPSAMSAHSDSDSTADSDSGVVSAGGKQNQGGEPVTSVRAKRAERGTRIPEGWRPNPERADLVNLRTRLRALGGDPEVALTEFKNHWSSTTKDATKLDWDRTFANRLMLLIERRETQPRGRAGTTTVPSKSERQLAIAKKLMDETKEAS